MSLFIYPYKMGSASVRSLKEATGAKIIKLENSRFRNSSNKTIINWGNGREPWFDTSNVLNKPENVALAANKLAAFEAFEIAGVAHVPFTTDIEEAYGWLGEGSRVFARRVLSGHSGEGIEVIDPPEETERDIEIQHIASRLENIGFPSLAESLRGELTGAEQPVLPRVPLYTRGVSNDGEYRVHVFNGEVILYQKKSRRVDGETGEVDLPEDNECAVRNLSTNWVYRTGNLKRLERVENLALAAIEALGLDFGAVDIIKDSNGDVFVLEVNTAPGLGNAETMRAYVEAITA